MRIGRCFSGISNTIRRFLKNSGGFTLTEIMVTFVVIGVLTTVAFTNYRAGEKQFALERSVHKLTQDLRSTEGMTVASKEFKGIFQGGYGIYFVLTSSSENSGSYTLFVDCNDDDQFNGTQLVCDDCSSGVCTASTTEKIETIYLEKGISVSQFVPVGPSLTVKFYPPEPTVAFYPDSDSVSIILSVSGLPVKTVVLNKAGLIEIQ